MSDFLRDLFPVSVEFSTGEQPTASKLTGWARQTNNGLNTVAKAIGDLWSDSHPLFNSTNTPVGGWAFTKSGSTLGTDQRHLQLLNLARYVGPSSALNPRGLTGITSSIVGEVIPSNVNHFYLKFIPKAGTIVFSNGVVFATSVGSVGNVNDTGEYYIDTTTGLITVWDTGSSPGTVSYDVDVSASYMGDSYEGASFNVLPDPNQSVKCTVTGPSGGRYTVALPIITDQQADWDDLSVTLDARDDLNYLAQLELPGYFAAEFTSGDQLPEGLVGLWDGSAKAFVEGIDFFYLNQNSLEVSDDKVLNTGSSQYSVVVVGTDISRTLDSLRSKYRKHIHDGTNGDMRVKHSDLSQLATSSVTIDSLVYAFTKVNTGHPNNDHPQYLHRGGKDASPLKNAMLGDLLFSATGEFGSSLFNIANSSYGIRWGKSDSNGAYLYWYATNSALRLDNRGLEFDKGIRGKEGGSLIKTYATSGTLTISGSSPNRVAQETLTALGSKTVYGFNLLVEPTADAGNWYPPNMTDTEVGTGSRNGFTIAYDANIQESGSNRILNVTDIDIGIVSGDSYRLVVFYSD